MRVFSGKNNVWLAERVCQHLGLPLAKAKTQIFPDSELIVEIEDDVRGRDCYLIISTSNPVNDNLMELMIFADSLRRSSARQIIVVMPYFGYARQDRKDKGRVPITAKLAANLITEAGVDRIVALDLHAAQIQGFFDIPVDHLSATQVFMDYIEENRAIFGDLCLVSPDVGNVKVAEGVASHLRADIAIINKRRIDGAQVASDRLIGDVKGKTVLLFDDMISTGGTVCEAAKTAIEHGSVRVIAAATHGVFSGSCIEKLAESQISNIIVTNSIPSGDKVAPLGKRYTELCVSGLLSEAIRRIHNNESLSAMFKRTAGSKR